MPTRVNNKLNFMVCGHAGHGKDYAADLICKFMNIEKRDSSRTMIETTFVDVFPRYLQEKFPEHTRGAREALRKWGRVGAINYLYDNRNYYRAELKQSIIDWIGTDLARLGRHIFTNANIYVGIRRSCEFEAIKKEGLFDLSIFIDRGLHKAPEPTCEITAQMCDITIDNNGTKEQLREKTALLCHYLSIANAYKIHNGNS